ncbi:hypothetical protein L2E82_50151 [Cichorium intybus]|nr:hypothetical protein L2E82_50151 [Cichorium intybus]
MASAAGIDFTATRTAIVQPKSSPPIVVGSASSTTAASDPRLLSLRPLFLDKGEPRIHTPTPVVTLGYCRRRPPSPVPLKAVPLDQKKDTTHLHRWLLPNRWFIPLDLGLHVRDRD